MSQCMIDSACMLQIRPDPILPWRPDHAGQYVIPDKCYTLIHSGWSTFKAHEEQDIPIDRGARHNTI